MTYDYNGMWDYETGKLYSYSKNQLIKVESD